MEIMGTKIAKEHPTVGEGESPITVGILIRECHANLVKSASLSRGAATVTPRVMLRLIVLSWIRNR